MSNERLKQIEENTATPTNVQAGLSGHPDSIAELGKILVDGQGGAGETIYTAGRGALAAMYNGLVQMHSARNEMLVEVQRGSTRTKEVPPVRAPELAAAMGQKFESCAKAVDRNLAAVNEAIGQLSQKIAIATSNPNRDRVGVAAAAGEIRQYIKAMPNSNARITFLQQAIADGDAEVVTAVLGTSGWVSGLDKKEFGIVREMAEKKFAPRESAQLAAANKVRDVLMTSSGRFVNDYVKLVPKVVEDRAATALKNLRGA